MLAAAASRPASSTSASTTFMPAEAARWANAKPIPLAAPVTTAVVPGVVCIALRSGGKCKDWPMQIAVVYASRTGNTRRAAELIATAVQERGHTTTVQSVDALDYKSLA